MADLRYAPVTLVFGADYNPDQWSKETWLEDIRLMKLAKVNLVTLPVFGWGQIEPQEGTFEFGWLDEVLELLYKNGINFNLATATATPPIAASGTSLRHCTVNTWFSCFLSVKAFMRDRHAERSEASIRGRPSFGTQVDPSLRSG